MSDDRILTVDRLSMRFGGIVAVSDLSFGAERRKITALIGPNGAGKTTVFNCITGFYKPSGGSMRLTHDNGAEIRLERLNDFRISKQAKVARTFQNIRLFSGMTVLENLVVAQHNPLMKASGFTFAGLIGLPSYRDAERAAIDKARYWLDRTSLLHRADDARLSTIPVIVVSAVAPEKPPRAYTFLRKPFTLETLSSAVRQCLAGTGQGAAQPA